MINVLIVDDSKVTRQVMRDILTSDPEIRVIGEMMPAGFASLREVLEPH